MIKNASDFWNRRLKDGVIPCYLVAIAELLKLCESSVFSFLERKKEKNSEKKKNKLVQNP